MYHYMVSETKYCGHEFSIFLFCAFSWLSQVKIAVQNLVRTKISEHEEKCFAFKFAKQLPASENQRIEQ